MMGMRDLDHEKNLYAKQASNAIFYFLSSVTKRRTELVGFFSFTLLLPGDPHDLFTLLFFLLPFSWRDGLGSTELGWRWECQSDRLRLLMLMKVERRRIGDLEGS